MLKLAFILEPGCTQIFPKILPLSGWVLLGEKLDSVWPTLKILTFIIHPDGLQPAHLPVIPPPPPTGLTQETPKYLEDSDLIGLECGPTIISS